MKPEHKIYSQSNPTSLAGSNRTWKTRGQQEFCAALISRRWTVRAAGRELGFPKSSISEYQNGIKGPDEAGRKLIQDRLGIVSVMWDQAPVPVDSIGVPTVSSALRTVSSSVSEKKQSDHPPTSPSETGGAPESGLSIARISLERTRKSLADETISVEARARLIALEGTLAKTIASLSGELDASELAAWKKSGEFRHLIGLAGESLRAYPEAAKALSVALGVAYEGHSASSELPSMCPSSPSNDALRLNLERLETWLGMPEQDPIVGCRALDGIVYPIYGREKTFAESDPEMARKLATAISSSIARIEKSRLSHVPFETYCRVVATRLQSEASRGDRIVAFRRDFGDLATGRAREAFG